MMQQRPTFIDLNPDSSDTRPPRFPSPSPRSAQNSPRMQHFAGDIPPAMSPLDMFAMQSRILARQLDNSKTGGRRVSRLPPLNIMDPIAAQKPMYDRSRSQEARDISTTPASASSRPREEEQTGTVPAVEEPAFRPKSYYPRMSHIRPENEVDGDDDSSILSPDEQVFATPAEHSSQKSPKDYFGPSQEKSPESAKSYGKMPDVIDRKPWVQIPRSQESSYPSKEPERGLSLESTSSRSHNGSLAPPHQTRSPHVRQAPSIRSIPQDSSDDELSASTGGSGFSQNRKLSSSSGVSMPHSPFSPYLHNHGHGRSPSLNSEYSLGGSRQPRAAFNFSRPLSRGSRPSIELKSRQPSFDERPSMDAIRPPYASLSRQPSADSQQRFLFDADETVQTPVSVDQESLSDAKEAAAPSYIYTKYSLPRGRVVQRDPTALEPKQMPIFEWDQPPVKTNVQPATPDLRRPASPSPRSQHSHKTSMDHRPYSPRPSFEQRPPSRTRVSTEQSGQNTLRAPDMNTSRPTASPVVSDDHSEYSASTRSGSTIKAPQSKRVRDNAPSMEVTAEDHLTKGIALHEKGEIKESTYHFRIAAKQNLPTGMLFYALACRHGWGMRPSPQDGVMWLRKAADSVSLDIATSDGDKDVAGGDIMARNARKAQFAYAIYELGVSHMNGLGIEQDKTLALRCFEIAANWGDADAMTECGFCYAGGQGTKKDLRKAAKYYKMAEAKGVSMVGNSWIHKPKYNDVEEKPRGSSDRGRGPGKPSTPEKEKKRDKSRTRTIFGRRKSVSQNRA